jgi:hypothetical protein
MERGSAQAGLVNVGHSLLLYDGLLIFAISIQAIKRVSRSLDLSPEIARRRRPPAAMFPFRIKEAGNCRLRQRIPPWPPFPSRYTFFGIGKLISTLLAPAGSSLFKKLVHCTNEMTFFTCIGSNIVHVSSTVIQLIQRRCAIQALY